LDETHNFEQIEFFSHEVIDLSSEFILNFVPLDVPDHVLVVQLLLVQRLVLVLPDV
jgi:hypothetical protein